MQQRQLQNNNNKKYNNNCVNLVEAIPLCLKHNIKRKYVCQKYSSIHLLQMLVNSSNLTIKANF